MLSRGRVQVCTDKCVSQGCFGGERHALTATGSSRSGRVCQCTCGQPSQSFFVTQKACSFTSGCSRGKSKRGGTLPDGSCAQEQSQIFSSLADAGCSAASLSCSCQWPQAQNK